MCEPINRSSTEVDSSSAATSSFVNTSVVEEKVCRDLDKVNEESSERPPSRKSESKVSSGTSCSRVDRWLLCGRPPNTASSDKGEGAKVLVLGEMDFTLALALHHK